MHYTLVLTSLIVNLYIAQQTSLLLGRFASLHTPVITSLFGTLYLAKQTR